MDMENLTYVFEVARQFASLGDMIGEQVLDVIKDDGSRDSDEDEGPRIVPGAAEYVWERMRWPLKDLERLDVEDLVEEIDEFMEFIRQARMR